ASEKIGQLCSAGTGLWTSDGNVAQTVFDAGTLEQKQRAAEETTNRAVAQYRSVVLAAFQNVADVLRALQADARAIDAATAAEQSASQNVDLVRKQVDVGQVNIPLLIEAQRLYLESSLARVDAQASQLPDTVALFPPLAPAWSTS